MTVENGQSTGEQQRAAFAQGWALRAALEALGHPVHLQHAGDFLVAFFSTPAEGRYGGDDGVRWREAAGGDFVVVLRIAAPRYLRHDTVNGRRYAQPAVATFTAIELARGRDPHPHATPQGAEADVARAGPDAV